MIIIYEFMFNILHFLNNNPKKEETQVLDRILE